jgi:hypothetical protein
MDDRLLSENSTIRGRLVPCTTHGPEYDVVWYTVILRGEKQRLWNSDLHGVRRYSWHRGRIITIEDEVSRVGCRLLLRRIAAEKGAILCSLYTSTRTRLRYPHLGLGLSRA